MWVIESTAGRLPWASEEGIALGQVATDQKSNEITAIPVLLDRIALTDAIITIDAMGCQQVIVDQIIDGGGDAVIDVKDNQPTLKAAIATLFDDLIEHDFEAPLAPAKPATRATAAPTNAPTTC